jgi:N-acetylglucosaminyl-diphospho-decaprenol L-rhamnosyltransferase
MSEATLEPTVTPNASDPAACGVSVVIVTWNSGQPLLDCLRSLQTNPPSVPWEVVIVDNGSTDRTLARVHAEFPAVRVIENGRNRGLAAANNQGITASRSPFVLISNPDVIYPPGAIDALLELLQRRPRAAFAVANLRYPDGRLQTSVGDLPSLRHALIGRRLSRHAATGACHGMWWHDWAHDEERAVGHGAEACYVARKHAIDEIGLQDERFVLDWEGVEWSRRAWDAGWEVWFCPAATVTHLEGTSRKLVPARTIFSTHLGMYLYMRRRARPALRPVLAAALLLRALAALLVAAAEPRRTSPER